VSTPVRLLLLCCLLAGQVSFVAGGLGLLRAYRLRSAPWRFAFVVAFAVAAVITLAGIGADDPYDGLLRGLLEAAAVLAGFGLLGPYLGLRSG
jgi:hypothetical protein